MNTLRAILFELKVIRMVLLAIACNGVPIPQPEIEELSDDIRKLQL